MKTSLTTRGAAVVKQAGYKPWPKLFQNMRSTLETELIGKYPIGDVVSWIGNSKPVAMKHYVQVQSLSFDKAIKEGLGAQGVVHTGGAFHSREPIVELHQEPRNTNKNAGRGVLGTEKPDGCRILQNPREFAESCPTRTRT